MTETIAEFGYLNSRKPAMRLAHTSHAIFALVRGATRDYLFFTGGAHGAAATGD